jgi:hypothetical protein
MVGLDDSCVLDEEYSGNARFWSMGAGDAALGTVGWIVGDFDSGTPIQTDDVVEVFELGADDCPNVSSQRDDTYAVYVGLESVDLGSLTLSDFAGPQWLALGESGSLGGNSAFVVELP